MRSVSACSVHCCRFPQFTVWAATSPDVFTFTMTADAVEPASCTLNEGKDVKVNFGEMVDIAWINGIKYKTEVAYHFHCDRVGKNVMTLEISGAEADFGQGMLSVRSGLGISILKDDIQQPINTPFAFDGSNPPVLMAVPVKNPGAVLTPGPFEATATIKVLYE